MFNKIINKKSIYKILLIIIGLLFLISLLVTGTIAWNNLSQHSSNEFKGYNEDKYQVILNKFEKDAEGNILSRLVPDAEFLLFKVGDPDEQIGETYITDEYGQIILTDWLGPGEYYFEEISPPLGYDYDQIDGENVYRYYFEIIGTEDNDCIIVSAYNKRKTGDLSIEKRIVPEAGEELTPDQREEIFEFIIIFSDRGTYSYSIDNGEELKIESGQSVFLKSGQKIYIKNIPYGVQYRIREKTKAGYRVKSTNTNGTITVDLIESEFINIPIEEDNVLEIHKEVISDEIDEDMEFAFTVTFSDGGTYSYQIDGGSLTEVASGDKIYLKHGQTARFSNLPYGITYEIVEEDYSQYGYIRNNIKYKGTISGDSIYLVFKNYKIEEPEETGKLIFTKEVEGEYQEGLEFEFQVDFSDKNSYEYYIDDESQGLLESGSSIFIKSGQIVSFPNLPHGITYEIKEINLPEGYFPIISESLGVIVGGYDTELSFVNGSKKESGKLRIKKKVEGEIPEGDKDKMFQFIIVINGEETIFFLKHDEIEEFILEYGSSYEIYEKDYYKDGYVLTPIYNSQGIIDQEILEIEVINKYVDTIMTEIKGEKKWDFSNSSSIAMPDHITVYLKHGNKIVQKKKVKADKNGKWFYSFTAPKYETDGNKEIQYSIDEEYIEGFIAKMDGYNITNIAVASVIGKIPEVTKVVQGKSGSSESFSFILEAGTKDTPMPGNKYGGYETARVNGEGSISFGKITFSRPGIYKYKVTEIDDGKKGYTYDNSIYNIKVTVIQEESRLVVKNIFCTKGNGKEHQEELVFVNKYRYSTKKKQSSDEVVSLKGSKIWYHDENEYENWPESIVVFVKNGEQIVLSKEITADDHWSWHFELEKYDSNGNQIKYTIDEKGVEGYGKVVQKYDIYNSYGFPDGVIGGRPKTGDNGVFMVWIILMIFSGLGMLIIKIYKRKYAKS